MGVFATTAATPVFTPATGSPAPVARTRTPGRAIYLFNAHIAYPAETPKFRDFFSGSLWPVFCLKSFRWANSNKLCAQVKVL
jgi:hypothetical protein